jgi:GNAT superfamily N-acetyltransferase
VDILKATEEDLEQMVAMADERRSAYSKLAPQFWRPATNAAELQFPFYKSFIADPDFLSLVAKDSSEYMGFLMAKLVNPPPVYNPGGPSCFIDDFYVRNSRWERYGTPLLSRAREWAAKNGASQFVIVSGTSDTSKMNFLESQELLNTSTWFTGRI